MIVDVHTHVFPPRMISVRSELAAADPGFRALYGEPAARMASADDLLSSMAAAGVDIAVAAGFSWRSPRHAEEHASYLLEVAERSGGSLVASPPIPALAGPGSASDEALVRARLRELRAAGARGVGELRLDAGTLPVADDDAAARARAVLEAARAEGLALLAHCTEPVGHDYPGKQGGLSAGAIWRLLGLDPLPGARQPPLIAAHWGGGLSLYAAMPEVRALFAAGLLAGGTAGGRALFRAAVFAGRGGAAPPR
ncbi:MAG: hypothetical protein OXC94_07210, partial [Chloroflexi bacterium]|nr:hypothetical protein [Chloroflexota bacterium]